MTIHLFTIPMLKHSLSCDLYGIFFFNLGKNSVNFCKCLMGKIWNLTFTVVEPFLTVVRQNLIFLRFAHNILAYRGGGPGPELGCLIVIIFHFVLREGSVRREGGGEVSVYFCNIKTSHELILLISIIFFCNFYNVLPFILISFS